MRQLRWPAATLEFNKLTLDVEDVTLLNAWWNLRWAVHLDPAKVFHASLSGRLTPDSGKVGSLYLAETTNTSFYEIYGDDMAAAKEAGTPFAISESAMKERVYATTEPPPPLRLYDLTSEGSAKAIGMDLATLYSAKVEYPRQFAQRLHDHSNRFDGIRYISRHTQGACVVLWPTYNAALQKLSLTRYNRLWDHATFSPALPPGYLQIFDDSVGTASP